MAYTFDMGNKRYILALSLSFLILACNTNDRSSLTRTPISEVPSIANGEAAHYSGNDSIYLIRSCIISHDIPPDSNIGADKLIEKWQITKTSYSIGRQEGDNLLGDVTNSISAEATQVIPSSSYSDGIVLLNQAGNPLVALLKIDYEPYLRISKQVHLNGQSLLIDLNDDANFHFIKSETLWHTVARYTEKIREQGAKTVELRGTQTTRLELDLLASPHHR